MYEKRSYIDFLTNVFLTVVVFRTRCHTLTLTFPANRCVLGERNDVTLLTFVLNVGSLDPLSYHYNKSPANLCVHKICDLLCLSTFFVDGPSDPLPFSHNVIFK